MSNTIELTIENKSLKSETYEEYVTKINKIEENELKWIYNIIEGTSQSILYDCERFVIIPDSNWIDKTNTNNLHILVIAKDKKLMSLRDIRKKDLSLLNIIKHVGSSLISSRFSVPIYELRAYIQYPPNTYLFHVHFENIKMPRNIKHININDVIKNVSLADDYYTQPMYI